MHPSTVPGFVHAQVRVGAAKPSDEQTCESQKGCRDAVCACVARAQWSAMKKIRALRANAKPLRNWFLGLAVCCGTSPPRPVPGRILDANFTGQNLPAACDHAHETAVWARVQGATRHSIKGGIDSRITIEWNPGLGGREG